MKLLEISFRRKIARKYFVFASVCFCAIGFVSAGHSQTDQVSQLISQLGGPVESDRMAAKATLVQIGAPAVEPLLAALRNPDSEVRYRAADCLGEIKDSRAVIPLITALKDFAPVVAASAVEALVKIGDRSAVVPLWAMVNDHSVGKTIRKRAIAALTRITNKSLTQLFVQFEVPPGYTLYPDDFIVENNISENERLLARNVGFGQYYRVGCQAAQIQAVEGFTAKIAKFNVSVSGSLIDLQGGGRVPVGQDNCKVVATDTGPVLVLVTGTQEWLLDRFDFSEGCCGHKYTFKGLIVPWPRDWHREEFPNCGLAPAENLPAR